MEKVMEYTDKVRVRCHSCKVEHDNEIEYGTDERYPDDFYIQCNHCSNWEEGSMPMQAFDLIHEDLSGRLRNTTKKDDGIMETKEAKHKVLSNEEYRQKVQKALEDPNQEVYSISIVDEDDKTFDIRIWDEREKESREDLEEGHIATINEAEKRLIEIINENEKILFLRLDNC